MRVIKKTLAKAKKNLLNCVCETLKVKKNLYLTIMKFFIKTSGLYKKNYMQELDFTNQIPTYKYYILIY